MVSKREKLSMGSRKERAQAPRWAGGAASELPTDKAPSKKMRKRG